MEILPDDQHQPTEQDPLKVVVFALIILMLIASMAIGLTVLLPKITLTSFGKKLTNNQDQQVAQQTEQASEKPTPQDTDVLQLACKVKAVNENNLDLGCANYDEEYKTTITLSEVQKENLFSYKSTGNKDESGIDEVEKTKFDFADISVDNGIILSFPLAVPLSEIGGAELEFSEIIVDTVGVTIPE